jgi:hypothetical protein
MNHFIKLLHVLILIFVFQALTGCGAGWIPTRFATLQEAYPPGDILRSMEVVPSDSTIQKVFNAPYEDVFRAAIVSASQTQWLVEVQDKANGVILAMRVLQIMPPPDTADCQNNAGANRRPSQRNSYYAVVIKEKGPKSIEVTAVAKAQGRCEHKLCWGAPSANAVCERYASLHWATGHDNALSELTQFMVFISNNLIAAGVS